MAKSRFLVQDYAGVTLVTFSDSSLLDAATIEQIGLDLFELTDRQNKQKLVLDFGNVKFLSSQTLGILLSLSKKTKAIKGELVLCGMRKELMKVFQITSLDKVFKFYKDDTAALAAFNVRVQ